MTRWMTETLIRRDSCLSQHGDDGGFYGSFRGQLVQSAAASVIDDRTTALVPSEETDAQDLDHSTSPVSGTRSPTSHRSVYADLGPQRQSALQYT
jgi:hypothetical protein